MVRKIDKNAKNIFKIWWKLNIMTENGFKIRIVVSTQDL